MKQTEMNEYELNEHMKDWARFLYKLYKNKKIRDLVLLDEDKNEN